MSDVFLSYSHADRQRAAVLARRLEERGFSVWWDSQLRGGRFAHQIEKEIDQARCVVVLWSHDSAESDWVPAEADRGRIQDKLVQVRLEVGNKAPLPFEWLHVLELTGWEPEPTQEDFRELMEAVGKEVAQSPLRRKLARVRRLWTPTPAPQLRAWDAWVAAILLVGVTITLGGWAAGRLNHDELGLFGSGVLVGWLVWLLLRSVLLRRLLGRRTTPAGVLGVAAIAGALGFLWVLGFHQVYSVPPFEEGVSGFYVARFDGDRWDCLQRNLAEKLEDKIAKLQLEQKLQVKRLGRRVRDKDHARRLLKEGNAALLMRGSASGSCVGDSFAEVNARVTLRRTPGVLVGGESLDDSRGASGVASARGAKRELLIGAIARFFAGYTLYHAGGLFDRAAKQFAAALDTLKKLEGANESLLPGLVQDGGIGVTESLTGTAALFLGNCLVMQGDRDTAIERYDEAIRATTDKTGPQFVEALLNKAFVLRQLNEIEPAVEAVMQARGLCREEDPASPRGASGSFSRMAVCAVLHHNLGIARVLQGNYEGARREFDTSTEFNAAATAMESRGSLIRLRAFNHQKLAWAAAKERESALASDRETVGDGAGLLETAESEWRTAESVWRTEVGEPLPAAFRITRARIDVAKGNWKEALDRLEGLDEDAARNEPEVLLLLGITQECSGDRADAIGSMIGYGSLAMASGADTEDGVAYYHHWEDACSRQR